MSLLIGCAAQSPGGRGRPVIVVSVLPQAFFVERIAGDLARIEVMIPPGASPATHEPTIGQLRAVSQASLYVKVGHPSFPFEQAWLDRLLRERPDLQVIDGSAGLGASEGGPHFWVSPRHAREMAKRIHQALRRILPPHTHTLDANFEELADEIDAVDAEIREVLRGLEGGKFVVFHPAWEYLAEEYGLEQLAIQAHGKEPDPKRLARLIDQAKALGVDVIFSQPHFDPSSAEVVAREIGARVEPLDPLAYDWSQNLRHVARVLAAAVRT